MVLIGMLTGLTRLTFANEDVYAVPETVNTAEQTQTEQQQTEQEQNQQDELQTEETQTEQQSTNNETTNSNTDNNTNQTDSTEAKEDVCKTSLGALGWVVCPVMNKVSEAVDFLYDKIEDILIINPVAAKDGSPIYEIWKYCLGVTNVVFIIFFLVVIYSQITGWGISNYGLKKALPKLIVMAIMVNISFLVCSIAVDVSNIVGNGLRGLFESVEATAMSNVSASGAVSHVSMAEIYTSMAGGTALAVGAGAVAFEFGLIWMLIPTALGAMVAVVTGLITIALRQAVVVLLVMISPLAFVAGILPNTEDLYKKWKNLLIKMLVFYPVFSLLFGASSLAGFAIIMSSQSGFGILLGLAVQIFPLFFSWKLMQMSGTFLGGINAAMRGLAAKPLATNRAWADSKRQQTSARMLALGRTPMSHLRRYVDNRKVLRDQHLGNLQAIRNNEANIYAQRKISGGYDGAKSQGNSEYLKPNKYTRAAKDASTTHLLSETASMDTAHALNNYGSYYVAKDIRDQIKAAEKAGNKVLAKRIRALDMESMRDAKAGKAFLEYGRAQMTRENDEEADFSFMVGNYLDASMNYDPKKVGTAEGREREENYQHYVVSAAGGLLDDQKMEKYRHYIMSSTGGLGSTGQARVLGKIIARAAAVESNQRRDIAIVAAKFPPDKRNFRNFLFNYYIDDDGYATDKEGNRIEEMRDYLRVNHPEKLVMWDQYDENGPYYDWYDVNGNYVTRIYKRDKSAIKELMSNFDAPINDPINNMLAIHAGIKEQPDSEIPVLRNMGLDAFRTTVGRALLSAPFKEKNAAFSPMVAEMVKKGYIKNYAQEYLAYLDSLNKATKPGAWNMQDSDAIEMFANMMDPDKWEIMFPTELIRGYLNVNGEPIYGIRYDESGNKVKVKAEEATREELMERVKEKYIIPAAKKIVVMMSRQTQNTMDNQKAGTIEKWKKLKDIFDTKWGDGGVIEVDPYEQNGDMRQITKDIRDSLYTVDENGNRHTFTNQTRRSNRGYESETETTQAHANHAAQIFEIFNHALDADDFATELSDYCNSYSEIAWIADQVQDFIVSEGYGVTKEQIYEFVEELLAYIDYD
ncbi:hypothetical protein IKF30_00880 [Candidatus Saccharibacteria bacterium]|nr:hypothetical protein [Candidatus Saccharibacteria bacterium]